MSGTHIPMVSFQYVMNINLINAIGATSFIQRQPQNKSIGPLNVSVIISGEQAGTKLKLSLAQGFFWFGSKDPLQVFLLLSRNCSKGLCTLHCLRVFCPPRTASTMLLMAWRQGEVTLQYPCKEN